jgi:hypothetical protein
MVEDDPGDAEKVLAEKLRFKVSAAETSYGKSLRGNNRNCSVN